MQSEAILTIGTIRYLTSLLAQADVRNSIPLKSEKLSDSMAFLAHVSTMLNIGRYNGAVVAVTGQLDKDKVKATIVVSKNSFAHSNGGPFDVEPACVTPTKFRLTDVVEFTKKPDDDITFLRHVEDLIGVLELSCRSGLEPAYVARWLTHRCHRKLSYRLGHMKREWETNPTVTMRSWEPTDSDGKFIESHACTITTLNQEPHQEVLGKAHITTTTVDSAETAKMFICGVATLLTSIHRLLDEEKLKQVTFVEIEYVFKVLATLDIILNIDVIRHIITKSSLSHMFQPKVTHSEGIIQLDSFAGHKTKSDANDGEDQDDDEVAETEQLPNETKGEHVFRYMRTLTAWITASRVVVGHLRKFGKQLSTSIVTLNDYSREALKQMKVLQDAIISQLKDEMADSTWLDKQAQTLRMSLAEGTVKAPRVHAEAGLMALAKVARDGTMVINSQEVKDVLMVDSVEIGVSKKCCYMCSMLGKILSRGTDARRMSVQLPGTHGHMFSWDPPQFGVSQRALDELANNLKEKVIELAKRHAAFGTRTRQSSPASEIEAQPLLFSGSHLKGFADTTHIE